MDIINFSNSCMNHKRATKILPRVLFSSTGHHVLTERGHNLGYSSRRERGRERRETSITSWGWYKNSKDNLHHFDFEFFKRI
jgi:hypothetical protein